MSTQTKEQIFLTHAGGSIMIVGLFIAVLFGIESESANTFGSLIILMININAILLIYNFISLPIYNSIEEFNGNDIVQLFRRLRISKSKADSSI
jgi:hypothetical protein